MCKIRTDSRGSGASGLECTFIPAVFQIYDDDALIVTDPAGGVSFWSEGATRIFGYSAEEMMGSAFSRAVPVEFQAEEGELLQALISGTPKRYEAARLCKDGHRMSVLASVSAIMDAAGSVISVLRCERAVSRGRGADEVVSRLAAIVESSDDAIVSKNLDGIVTSWNQAASGLFGYTPEEMIGQPILKIIPEDLYSEEVEILRKIRAGVRIDHYETRRLRKDGEIVEVSITISPVRDASGRIVGSSKIARDISERKKLELQLLQSEKLAAAGVMAANVAHEINNPLESVINLIYLARLHLSASSTARPYLAIAESELERVSHLARQALGYYREPGAVAEIHVGALLEEVLRSLQAKLHAAKVAADCTFDGQRPVTGSGEDLMQVFSNLVTNAIEAMPAGGVLKIRTREVGDEGVEVLVIDRGKGISAEDRARVFEPFFTTKRDHGTGIGLWTAQQLLKERGGSISIESKTEGAERGTTVTVFLPFKARGSEDPS